MSQVTISSIQSMIAPAVLMTTAAIRAGGVQNMYSSVNDRMRNMNNEKMVLLSDSDGGLLERRTLGVVSSLPVDEINVQLPRLRARYRTLRAALEYLYVAIVPVVLTMILIAVAITLPAAIAGTLALVAILLAAVALLFGLGAAALSPLILTSGLVPGLGLDQSLVEMSCGGGPYEAEETSDSKRGRRSCRRSPKSQP